jgi:fucose permease
VDLWSSGRALSNLWECGEIIRAWWSVDVLVQELPGAAKTVTTDWLRVFIAYFCLFVLGFLDTIRGPYFPDIGSDLHLNDSTAALFFVVASAMMILTNRLTPSVVRRFGLRSVLMLSNVLMGAGFWAASTAESLVVLLLSVAVFGVGFGFINVGQNVLIFRAAAPALRRQLFSGLHSVYAFASLTAPLWVGVLASWGYGWRIGFQTMSVLCAAGAVICFRSEGGSEAPTPPARPASSDLGPSWRLFLPWALQMSFYIAAELSISTRFPLYLRRAWNFEPVQAAQYLAYFFAFLLVGRLLFTFFRLEHLSNKTVLMTSLVLSTVLYLIGLHFHPLFIAATGLTMAPVFGVSLDSIANVFKDETDHAIAWMLSLSGVFIIGMHMIVGFVSDLSNIQVALHVGPLFLVVSALLLTRLRESTEPSEALER